MGIISGLGHDLDWSYVKTVAFSMEPESLVVESQVSSEASVSAMVGPQRFGIQTSWRSDADAAKARDGAIR